MEGSEKVRNGPTGPLAEDRRQEVEGYKKVRSGLMKPLEMVVGGLDQEKPWEEVRRAWLYCSSHQDCSAWVLSWEEWVYRRRPSIDLWVQAEEVVLDCCCKASTEVAALELAEGVVLDRCYRASTGVAALDRPQVRVVVARLGPALFVEDTGYMLNLQEIVVQDG